jgi:predicted flap endonuclease-1-like 5' DNA nuclease
VRSRIKDDLQKIFGIGPVMERTLNRLGIYRYKQIANWRDRDVARVAAQIDTFPDRIKRDNWIGGAKKQHLLKYKKPA